LYKEFESIKMEYQNLINLQMEKIRKHEHTILEKNKAIDENAKKLEIMFNNYKKFDIERTKFESTINELLQEKKMRDDKIVELLLNLEDKEKVILNYKENLSRHEIESSEMARKLAELKNAIIESNMVIQTFRCEKVGNFFNDNIDITFGRTDENEYVMIVKEDNYEEFVNVEDIDHMKTNDKFKDMIDVCYMVNKNNIIL
jgi:hypothetical protein